TVISFLKENFKGAIEIRRGELPLGSIRVATEGFAYFLKLLLKEVMGDGNVKAALRADTGELIFEIRYPKRTYSIESILYYAEKSGFRISGATDSNVTLSIPVTPEKVKTIYAISPSILRSTLIRIVLNA
ncbi:MAG: hypothetical protein J6Q69_00400, partial [Clostridia bacterium]|nr:hypothetical protein [Clostridia bacterium]